MNAHAQTAPADEMLSIVDKVALAIGFNATCDLCARFGGRTLYIPSVPNEKHVLTLVLGKEKAHTLGKALGSTDMMLPTLKEVGKKRHTDLICRKIAHGESDRDILLSTDTTQKELTYIKRTYADLIQAYVLIADRQNSFIRAGKPKKRGD